MDTKGILTVAALAALPGVLLAHPACSPPPVETAPDEEVARADTLTGEVRQVGSVPFVRTVVEGEERSLTVTGRYEPELARLAGARVRVSGERVDEGFPGPGLRVTSYEIVSVDGDRPVVGKLRHGEARGYELELEDGERVPLRAVPTRLGQRVGAKVWIVTGDEGAVLRYGLLREARQ